MARRSIKQAEEFLVGIYNRIDHGMSTWIKLTNEEWDEVKEIVLEHGFPCEPIAHGMGAALSIRKHSDLPDVKPDQLLLIDETQLPEVMDAQGLKMDRLEVMAQITHTEKNATTLLWYGMEAPRELSHYCY